MMQLFKTKPLSDHEVASDTNTTFPRIHGMPTEVATLEALPPAQESDYLSMVVLVNTIGDENALYNAYPADGAGSVRLMSRARSLHVLEEEARRFRANVVLIDSNMVEDVKALAQVIPQFANTIREYPNYHRWVVSRRAVAGNVPKTWCVCHDHVSHFAVGTDQT
ncbi:MAG: hypothetical protein HC853_15905 [Anaerolineae bacterium]|nr:hypothetical protein [Anaerolineae bacterium]